MKMLLCPQCRDVVALTYDERACACGKASGRYVDDRNAEVYGDPVVLGMRSEDIVAIATFAILDPGSEDLVGLHAFVIQRATASVRRMSRKRRNVNPDSPDKHVKHDMAER